MAVWDLSGSQWATSVLYLQGISLVRRNNEWHYFDLLGTAQVVSNNVYDLFGVLRYEQGSAQTPWRWTALYTDGEALLSNGYGMSLNPVRSVVLRWSWKWPPFRIRPPWGRVPPGFGWGFCLASCGLLLYEFAHHYRGQCSGVGDFWARFRCALCNTYQGAGGLALGFCMGCLCLFFGGGFGAAVICGGVGFGAVGLIGAGYQPPQPPEYHFHFHFHFGPIPVPPDSSSPGFI